MQAPEPDAAATESPAEPSGFGTSNRDPAQRAVLIGASVRAAAQSAQRAGWLVFGIDRFGDRDTQAACERFQDWEGFAAGADQESSTGAWKSSPLVRVGGLVDLAPATGRKIDAHLATSTDCKHPDELQRIATTAGVRFPETRFVLSNALPERSNRQGSWLRKKIDSCGGLGVYRETIANSGCEEATEDCYWQRRIAGRAYGATLYRSANLQHLLGVCRSLTHRRCDRPYVYAGAFGPVDVSETHRRQLLKIATACEPRTPFPLLNIDYVVDSKEQIWLLEINHRWSASMEVIDLSHDWRSAKSLFGLAMQDELEQAELERIKPSGKRFLKRVVYARRPMMFDLDAISRTLSAHETIHDLPDDGAAINPGEPICTSMTRLGPASRFNPLRFKKLIQQIANRCGDESSQ